MTDSAEDLALRAAQATFVPHGINCHMQLGIPCNCDVEVRTKERADLIQRIIEPALAERDEIKLDYELATAGAANLAVKLTAAESREAALRGELEKARTDLYREMDSYAKVADERDAALLVLRRIGEALELTQQIVMGSFAKGWTIHVTGHQMDSIRAAISEARAAVKEK